MSKMDILVFGAHPDDAELGAGATIAKEIASGKKVGIVDLTRGELGTRGSAETRALEAEEAARILGVSHRSNLELPDGFFRNNESAQKKVIQAIRHFKPDLILCNATSDRHIDHGRGSQLVSEACFLSGLAKIETQGPEGEAQEAWRPRRVYHYIQWNNNSPDFAVDVSGFIETKLKAVRAYRSQFFDPESQEPETPISSRNFLDSVEYRARDLGRLLGVPYAEGFTWERIPLVSNLDQLN